MIDDSFLLPRDVVEWLISNPFRAVLVLLGGKVLEGMNCCLVCLLLYCKFETDVVSLAPSIEED